MYDSYIVRRTQIYLDPEQSERLGELSVAEGRTRSDLIREAVDTYLDAANSVERRLERIQRALRALAAGPDPLINDEEFAKFREADRRHVELIERRWTDDVP